MVSPHTTPGIISIRPIIYVEGLEKSNYLYQHIDEAGRILLLPGQPTLIKSKPKFLFRKKIVVYVY